LWFVLFLVLSKFCHKEAFFFSILIIDQQGKGKERYNIEIKEGRL
jgi:hypothetical protein